MKKEKKNLPKKKSKTVKENGKTRETQKKKKLVSLISVNFGKTGKDKMTMYEMMIESGYSESSAKQQSTTLLGVKKTDEFQKNLQWMKDHRDKIKARMDALVGKAGYADIARTIDRLDRSIELAEGRPTGRTEIVGEGEKEELDALLDDNR